MSTYHLSDALRPLVDWTAWYAARRALWPAVARAAAATSTLSPHDAAQLIHTIDAVCAAAPSSDLPFEDYAVLDELGASLADWLRHVSPDRVPVAAVAA